MRCKSWRPLAADHEGRHGVGHNEYHNEMLQQTELDLEDQSDRWTGGLVEG